MDSISGRPPEKSHPAWVGRVVIVAIVVAIVLLLVRMASAQTPTRLADAAVRIADAAQPAGVLVDPLDCLERAAKVFQDAGKAAKYCRDVFHSGGKVMEKVANEAADATVGAAKGTRPVVVDSPYGYGYRRRYYSGGYGCRWPCGY